MFINVEKKNYSEKFLKSMAKLFEKTVEDQRKIEDLYETKEKGVYASYFHDAKMILNPLRYSVVPEICHELSVVLPKSILKRERRKFERLGLYSLNNDFYLKHYTDMIKNNSKLSEERREYLLKNLRKYSVMKDYGVCDDATQARERFRFLEKLEEKYIIMLQPIWRSAQSKRGGFRYHKHGPYIGKQKPRHEYLYDDEHIDKVFLFSVTEVKEKGAPDFKGHNFIIEKSEVFNKNEELVAIYHKDEGKIVCGYSNEDETLLIPKEIQDQNKVLEFLDENKAWFE